MERRPAIPRAIWALGMVSLLMDIASEMIHSLLPLFLVGTLGASMLAVGLIEGIAEATALITKVFSGTLSDRFGRRKGLVLFGYALGAATKPLFALAGGLGLVVTARFLDRIGKGIRDAPRDALIADLTPAPVRGAAFGLRQALDTAGAFIGPLLATALMLLWAGDFRAVFWVAVIPGALAVLVLALGVQEPERAAAQPSTDAPRVAAWRRLGTSCWWVVAVGAAFSLARFSQAFLVLRAAGLGVPAAAVPLVMMAMNLVYAASAYPFGRLADRMSRSALLAAGLATLVAADLALAAAQGWALLALGIVLWGAHLGMTQGLLAAMVADAAPQELRGTAYGVFNLVSGLALLLASATAGWLWERVGPAGSFLAGAGFATLCLLLAAAGRWLALRRRAF